MPSETTGNARGLAPTGHSWGLLSKDIPVQEESSLTREGGSASLGQPGLCGV